MSNLEETGFLRQILIFTIDYEQKPGFLGFLYNYSINVKYVSGHTLLKYLVDANIDLF